MRTNRACGYLKEQLRAKRSVPSMQILVRVVSPPVVAEFVPGPGGPGKRFVFSEDFLLERYDGAAQNNQLAGSHSGFVTTLRIAEANDRLYPEDGYLFQYEGIYMCPTLHCREVRSPHESASRHCRLRRQLHAVRRAVRYHRTSRLVDRSLRETRFRRTDCSISASRRLCCSDGRWSRTAAKRASPVVRAHVPHVACLGRCRFTDQHRG